MNYDKDEQIMSNQGLIYYVINNKQFPYEYYEDIVSVGNIGLIKAVNTFKQEKGYCFSTYAIRCIENEINMYMRKELQYRKVLENYDLIIPQKEESYWKEIKYNMLDHISKLEPKARDIITYRYGLNDTDIVTQSKLALSMNTTQSHISKLENQIIGNLRKQLYR